MSAIVVSSASLIMYLMGNYEKWMGWFELELHNFGKYDYDYNVFGGDYRITKLVTRSTMHTTWNTICVARERDAGHLETDEIPLITSFQELIRGTRYLGNSPDVDAGRRYRTLSRCYHELRCGIFVRIENREVTCFTPFVNTEYKNKWHGRARYGYGGKSAATWLASQQLPSEGSQYLINEANWWTNGGILCNEVPIDEETAPWGNTYLYHILFALINSAPLLDHHRAYEFMVNKRDHPQDLRVKGYAVDPYPFLWKAGADGKMMNPTLMSDQCGETLKFLSFYSSPIHSDIVVPNTDDIEASVPGNFRFPPHFADTRSRDKVESRFVPWKRRDLKNPAFFRGGATGSGVIPATNVRLALATLSVKRPDMIDAGVVSWNRRAKFQSDGTVLTIDPKALHEKYGITRVERVPQWQQAAMPILIYADGHCAASRLGSMMALGSVVLRIESQAGVPGLQWSLVHPDFGLAQSGCKITSIDDSPDPEKVTHLVIRADLSNLAITIQWIHTHAGPASLIADNALIWSSTVLTPKVIFEAYAEAIRSCI